MSQDLKSIIGARVRAARRAKGLTQAEIAEAVNRTTEAISNIERAKSLPPLDLLDRIAQATDSKIASLVEEPSRDGPVNERIRLETDIAALVKRLPIEYLRIAVRQIEAFPPKQR